MFCLFSLALSVFSTYSSYAEDNKGCLMGVISPGIVILFLTLTFQHCKEHKRFSGCQVGDGCLNLVV